MAILKLRPGCMYYLWGGDRLIKEYGKVYEGDILAETWELSCHPAAPSHIAEGPYAGKTLREYIDREGKAVLGRKGAAFADFPILIKLIDARDNLSVQVHPGDDYALAREGEYGKTEMWYIMDAAEDAFIYYGFQKEISLEEFRLRIENDTLLEVLQAVPVKKGDSFFIEAGTIHAIGKNILVAEIQQNSNITYRVYDYGRVDKDGRKRQLHIEQALAVTKRQAAGNEATAHPHLAKCPYFTVDKLYLDGRTLQRLCGTVDEESFLSLLFLTGEGRLINGMESLSFRKGECFFLPAGSGEYSIEGSCEVLLTKIEGK